MTTTTNRPARILLGIALLAGIPAAWDVALSTVPQNPAALTIGLPFGLAYLLLTFVLLRISPAWPGRPLGWMLAALAWGAGPTFLFIKLAGPGLSTLTRQLHVPMFSASLAGALPEELGKALGVLVVVLACRRIDRPWHVLAVATMVGLGFALVENIGYGASGGLTHPESDQAGVMRTWITRSVAGLGIHSIYTTVATWGLAQALFARDRSRGWRVGVAVAWFLVGFGLHFTWNSSPESPVANLLKLAGAAIVSYGLYLFLYVRTWRVARRARNHA